jgi:hypothetical protein
MAALIDVAEIRSPVGLLVVPASYEDEQAADTKQRAHRLGLGSRAWLT